MDKRCIKMGKTCILKFKMHFCEFLKYEFNEPEECPQSYSMKKYQISYNYLYHYYVCFTSKLLMRGVNAKQFYLLIYSLRLRTPGIQFSIIVQRCNWPWLCLDTVVCEGFFCSLSRCSISLYLLVSVVRDLRLSSAALLSSSKLRILPWRFFKAAITAKNRRVKFAMSMVWSNALWHTLSKIVRVTNWGKIWHRYNMNLESSYVNSFSWNTAHCYDHGWGINNNNSEWWILYGFYLLLCLKALK